MTSYAQNFEDVMLRRALRAVRAGVYIDVGAQDPVVDSVSLAFYEQGWTGIDVEPSPHFAERLRQARPLDLVLQTAVGDHSGLVTLYEVPGTGLSTCSDVVAAEHQAAGRDVQRVQVPSVPLASILDRYCGRDIHWLKVDVEGMEQSVLRSWLPSSARPWVVVVESTHPLSQTATHTKWEHILHDLGYTCRYFDGLNRFYVSHAHWELTDAFDVGPNVFDDFRLSGTSSAPFCDTLVRSLATQAEETTALRGQAARLTDNLHAKHHALEAQLRRIQALERCTREQDETLLIRQRKIEQLTVTVEMQTAELGRLTRMVRKQADQVQHGIACVASLTQRLNERATQLEAANAQLDDRRIVIDEMTVKMNESRAEASRHLAEVSRRLEDLATMRASTSWKVTGPLRAFGAGLKSTLRFVRQGTRFPQRLVRSIVKAGRGYVRRRPTLKRYLLALRSSRPEPVIIAAVPPVAGLDHDPVNWDEYPRAVRARYVELMLQQVAFGDTEEVRPR